eukprot:179032_1
MFSSSGCTVGVSVYSRVLEPAVTERPVAPSVFSPHVYSWSLTMAATWYPPALMAVIEGPMEASVPVASVGEVTVSPRPGGPELLLSIGPEDVDLTQVRFHDGEGIPCGHKGHEIACGEVRKADRRGGFDWVLRVAARLTKGVVAPGVQLPGGRQSNGEVPSAVDALEVLLRGIHEGGVRPKPGGIAGGTTEDGSEEGEVRRDVVGDAQLVLLVGAGAEDLLSRCGARFQRLDDGASVGPPGADVDHLVLGHVEGDWVGPVRREEGDDFAHGLELSARGREGCPKAKLSRGTVTSGVDLLPTGGIHDGGMVHEASRANPLLGIACAAGDDPGGQGRRYRNGLGLHGVVLRKPTLAVEVTAPGILPGGPSIRRGACGRTGGVGFGLRSK